MKASVAAAAALLLGASAFAQPADSPPAAPADRTLIERLSGREMLSIMAEVGFTGDLGLTNDGNPRIEGRYTDPDTKAAYSFAVTLYRCENDACYDIVFTRSFDAPMPVTLQMVNKYNQTRLFGVAYLDTGGAVGQSLSHTIQGGVTRQTVKEIIDWWREVMVTFEQSLRAH
jgi:hypothetical protein